MKRTVFYDFYQVKRDDYNADHTREPYYDEGGYTSNVEIKTVEKTLIFQVDKDCINQFISEVILGIPYQEIDALRRMEGIPGIDDLERVNAMPYYDQQMLDGHLATIYDWTQANFVYSLEIYTREVYTND